jgi:hypothetical protein
MWLVMSDGNQTAPNKYEGPLYRTTGPGFNAQTFTPITSSNYTSVGNLAVTFSDANTGSMTYTVNGVAQTKPIARYIFATAPNCQLGGSAGSTPNYSDLWWRADGTESGWGVNLVHQGDILFATWFTYEAGGTASSPAKGMWLVMSNGNKTGDRRLQRRFAAHHGAESVRQRQSVQPEHGGTNDRRQCDVHIQRREQRHVQLHGQRSQPVQADPAAGLFVAGDDLQVAR